MRDDVDTQATFKALRKWKKTEFGRRWRETPFDIRGKLDTALEGCVWERARGLYRVPENVTLGRFPLS